MGFEHFQMGSIFPDISLPVLCFQVERRISKLEIAQLKFKIMDYLKKHKKAYVSDLAVKLDVEPRKIVQAVKELREEGVISVE